MKKNRYTPFGYQIENGEVTLLEPESDAVRLIYNEYLRGYSLKDIAGQMTRRGIPYSEASTVWNKHMVKRILDNRKYTGGEGYPPLVTQDVYCDVHRSKSEKYLRKEAHIPAAVEAVKGKVCCYECGHPFARLHDRHLSPKWYCRNKNCKTDLKVTDTLLLDGVTSALNRIIADPDILKTEPVVTNTYSPEAARTQNEINRELSKAELNAERVRALLFTFASEKYAVCADDSCSDDMRAIFNGSHILTEFDIQLFEQTVDSIEIAKNCDIYLRLKNSQTLTVSNIYSKEEKHDY